MLPNEESTASDHHEWPASTSLDTPQLDSYSPKASEREQDSVHVAEQSPDESFRNEEAVLRRAALELVERKAELRAAALARINESGTESLETISTALEDPSPAVRNASIRALYELNAEVATSVLNERLRLGTHEQRRRIGNALTSSGLAAEAAANLNHASPESMYRSVSLLFLLAKAGEVQPLLGVIENYENLSLRLALIKLLSSSGSDEVLTAFHRLAQSRSLDAEVRSEVMRAICEIGTLAADERGKFKI
jgi:HEAT repeat protein